MTVNGHAIDMTAAEAREYLGATEEELAPDGRQAQDLSPDVALKLARVLTGEQGKAVALACGLDGTARHDPTQINRILKLRSVDRVNDLLDSGCQLIALAAGGDFAGCTTALILDLVVAGRMREAAGLAPRHCHVDPAAPRGDRTVLANFGEIADVP